MKLKLVLIGALLLSSFAAQAGNEIGNGGLGITVESGGEQKIWLLDFAENGIQDAAYDKSIPVDLEILARVQSKLNGALCNNPRLSWPSNDVCERVALKFSNLKKVEPFIFNALFFAFENLEFRVVETPVIPSNDVGNSPIEYDRARLRQLAIRLDNVVRIDRKLIDKNSLISVDHIVGLVFHEIIFAFRSNYVTEPLPVARNIREAVGYIFSNADIKVQPMVNLLPDYLPKADVGCEMPGSWKVNYDSYQHLNFSFRKANAKGYLEIGVSDLQSKHEFEVATTKQPITTKMVTDYCKNPQRDRTGQYIGITLSFDGRTQSQFAGENIQVVPGRYTCHEGRTELYFLRIYADLKDDKTCIARLTKDLKAFAADALGGYTSLENVGIYNK